MKAIDSPIQCKLCGEVAPLLKRSHIIPDFMYRDLFDEKHKLYKFAPAELIDGRGRVARPSSGEYDSDILCAQCDNTVLGGYEQYARNALYSEETKGAHVPQCAYIADDSMPHTHCRNLDYKQFKLFLLSVLWRASVTQRPFFRAVSLGPYEDIIRDMIYTGTPGGIHEFPILMMTWLHDREQPQGLILQPGINRKEKGIRYVFIIAGIIYVFHISPISLQEDMRPYILLPSNEARILHIPKGKFKHYSALYCGLKRIGDR